MLRLSIVIAECRFLATLFNIQISGLADRFLMEIKENVNLAVFHTPAAH
jgi:hypothetical protein